MERSNAGLSSVPDDFYTQLAEYVNSLITEYKKTGSPNDMRKLENTLKVARDIFERRVQKILVQALRAGKENSPENMGLVGSALGHGVRRVWRRRHDGKRRRHGRSRCLAL